MELNKLCRTCLSTSEDMKSLYETCATSTQMCCAEMLSTFTPLLCCKDDGLPTMICHNCIREVNRCYTFQLKCLESDGVLRKHVQRLNGVAGTNITGTNEHTDSRNHQLDLIKLEEDMEEGSRIFEEVSIKNEFPISSKRVISVESLKDPLSTAETEVDMDQELDIVKHEVPMDIKIEEDTDINFEVKHVSANKQESEKPYSCTVCNKSFKQKHHLTSHMCTHTGEKPFSCTICDSSFKQPNNLRRHMRTHTGEKPYPCAVCDSSFTSTNHLTIHMRTHTGEKPYACTICNKSCRQSVNLRIHMRTHTGEKPYTCTVCNHSYRQKQHLITHMRTHAGEKQYSCTVCGMSFRHTHNLNVHLRTHAGEQSYSCTICNSSFKTKRILTIHKRKHTGEKS